MQDGEGGGQVRSGAGWHNAPDLSGVELRLACLWLGSLEKYNPEKEGALEQRPPL